MSFAFVQDVPIDWETYRRLMVEVGEPSPSGLLVHLVVQREKGLRYIDVWESREAHGRFMRERVHPALGRLLEKTGAPRPPEPTMEPIEVREILLPAPGSGSR
jgi:hypothetical protein